MKTRITAALDALAQSDGIRILLAVESGSRAWGFPSRDSDWDVRLLFVRPLGAYLSVEPPPETIERMLPDELDVAGWDLRKALGLLIRSNAAAAEWLASPVVYCCDPAAVALLARVARQTAHLPALAYHYDRSARRFWPPADGMPLRLKSLFYALRPALALRWMRTRHTPPPMDLPPLMDGLPASLATEIGTLLAIKAEATEATPAPAHPAITQFLTETLAAPVERPGAWDKAAALQLADAAFRQLVGIRPYA